MIYENSTYHSKLLKKIMKYWTSLQQKYNIQTEFRIVSVEDYFKIKFNYSSSIDIEDTTKDVIIEILEKKKNVDITGEILFESLSGFYLDDDEKIKIQDIVIMKRENFYFMCLILMGKPSLMMKWMKRSLLHEMGHLVSNHERYEGMDIHEFMKQREVEETAIQEHNSKIKDLEGREYIQAYHSGLDEKRANEQVGLTWKDMWKIEDEISDVYYYNIELSGEKR